MPHYKYLGEVYASRRDLKDKTGFSSCKIDAKIREGKIIKIEGNSDEKIYNHT